MKSFLKTEREKLEAWSGVRPSGRVTHVIGLLIESIGPDVAIGEVCYIYGKDRRPIHCQVVGFKDHKVLLMALADLPQISPGAEVFPTEQVHKVACCNALCGRVLDALGSPIDGKGPLFAETTYPVRAMPPPALSRPPIDAVLSTGIKAIDGFCTLGWGQRIGIFSPPGVGKSTLMGWIAKKSTSDINVIALVGERGREVRSFIEHDLGPEGLAKSVIVVATSDQSALLRKKAANVATAIAEYFRDQGKRVILMMDSISRYAMALREIGLAIGEPPTTRGYPPSVFAELPALLERAGNSEKGSITGVYTVLNEEEEMLDPIPEQMRSLLDGHILLSRSLAESGHFPPIDILKSLSRLMSELTSSHHRQQANQIRSYLHTYQTAKELINIGAYVSGSNPKIDIALEKIEPIKQLLIQNEISSSSFEALHENLSV